jgi:crotonobetainyl-CoA:carnitine CoA-transferase CaiB-like acyl-CoA transferase
MHLVTAKVGGRWRRGGRLQVGTIYPTGFFECADGYVCIASQTPKQWGKLLRAMGDPPWAAPEAAHRTTGLGPDPALVDGPFRAWLRKRTRAEITELAIAEDVTLGAVMTPAELLEDKHLQDRDAWSDLAVGTNHARIARPGLVLDRSPLRTGGKPPRLDTPSRPGDLRARHGREAQPHPGPGKEDERRPPLDGVRVLDFTWNWAGPMATQLLADMGADVIRVETAKRQDLMRLLDMTSWFFCHNNRSKRSVAVNVADREGAQVVHRLLPAVDIVVDNFTPGVMQRNGLDYESLRAVKPDIISVSMSIAGQTGPLRGMRGFAAMGTGFAGLERLVGYEDGTATGLMSFGLGDVTLAIHATIGALAALRHRDRTGEGQLVDVSMIEAVLGGLADPLLDVQLNGRSAGPQGNSHRAHVPHGVFRCAGEDRWTAIAVRHPHEWQALCRVLGREEWATDPSLAAADGRRRRREEIDAAIAAWCAERERDEAVATLRAAAVPVAPLLGLEERNAHPHFVDRGFVVDHDAGFDRCQIYATPWRLSATPPAVRRPTPVLGEHTVEVLRDLAGFSDAEIERLTQAEVLT